MTQIPSDDQKLQAFLHQHRPVPPPAPAKLEEQLMNAIEIDNTINKKSNLAIAQAHKTNRVRRLWIIYSTLAASLLISWNSSNFFFATPELANANLESFLETNWNDVTGGTATNPTSNNLQNDWMLETNSIN